MRRFFIALGLALVFGTTGVATAQGDDRLAPGPHDARLGEVTLHYVVAGHGGGTPVLVPSPNWGPGSLYLQRGLQPLTKDHLLVFIDSRGSGGSSHPADEKRMSTDDMADDIEGMRRYLDLARFDLIGHSAAGGAAIEYAERYQGHLDRLVLVDAATIGSSPADLAETAQNRADIMRLAREPAYASAVDHMLHDPFPPADDTAMMRMLENTGALDFADPTTGEPRFAKTITGMVPSAYAFRTSVAADRAHPLQQEAKLNAIAARVLIVQGRQDWLVPALTAQHLHQGIAESQLLELDSCGHMPWIEKPDAFFPAVDAFLKASP